MLKGAQFGEEGRKSRIQGYEKKLYAPYIATYNVGDNSTYSRTRKIYKGLNAPVLEAVATTERKNKNLQAQISGMSNDKELAAINQRINNLEGNDSDTSSAISVYGAKKYAKEQADGVLGKDTDSFGATTVKGMANSLKKISKLTGNDFIGLMFVGGVNTTPQAIVGGVNPLAVFVPNNEFKQRYTIIAEDKFPNMGTETVMITKSNYSDYTGTVIYIKEDITNADFISTFEFSAKEGDWLVASPYGWKKISGSDVGGSNGGIQPYFIDEVSISRLIELYGTGYPMQQISDGLYDAVWSAMSQGNPVYIRYHEGIDDSWILLNLVYEDLIYFSCVDDSSNIITGELTSDGIAIWDITNAIALKDLANDLNQDIGELYDIKQDTITDLDAIREGKVYITRFNFPSLINGANIPITTTLVEAMNDRKVILIPNSNGGYVTANVMQCSAVDRNISINLQIYDGAILYTIKIFNAQQPSEDGTICKATVTRDILIKQGDVKTINGQSILGTGDITISGGGSTLTEEDIANMGFTKNVGTVTSVAGVMPGSDGAISSLMLNTQSLNDRVQKVTSPPRTLKAGYVYVVTNPISNIAITNLAINTDNTVEEYTMHFVTSSNGASCNITPAGLLYWASEKPTALPANTYYELSIIKITISGSSYFKAVLTPFA